MLFVCYLCYLLQLKKLSLWIVSVQSKVQNRSMIHGFLKVADEFFELELLERAPGFVHMALLPVEEH